jgi:subtilase family serine protease
MLEDRSKRWAIVGIVLVVLSVALWSEFEGTGAFKLNPIGHADLEVAAIELEQTEITAVIYNSGTDAQKGFTVYFYERESGSKLDWTFLGEKFVETGLGAEESIDVVFDWAQIVANDREVKVVVDAKNVILERNEDNNEESNSVTIREVVPDLYVDSIVGEASSVRVGIVNSGGTQDSIAVVKFFKYVAGVPEEFYTYTIEEIIPAHTYTISAPIIRSDESELIRVVVDTERNVVESNEDNNVLEREI